MPHAKIYSVLNGLARHSLLHSDESRPKKYYPLPADALADALIRPRKTELDQIRESVLAALSPEPGLKPNVKALHSKEEVWRNVYAILSGAKRNIRAISIAKMYEKSMLMPDLMKLGTRICNNKGITFRILSTESLMKIPLSKLPYEAVEFLANPRESSRVLPDDMLRTDVLIADGEKAEIPAIDPETHEYVSGVLIEGRELVAPFVAYFEDLWEKAVPIEDQVRKMAKEELKRRGIKTTFSRY